MRNVGGRGAIALHFDDVLPIRPQVLFRITGGGAELRVGVGAGEGGAGWGWDTGVHGGIEKTENYYNVRAKIGKCRTVELRSKRPGRKGNPLMRERISGLINFFF